MKPLLVVAGEASGDLHGGELLKELKALMPDLRLVGIGGERMTPYLDRKVADINELSVMGLAEVVTSLPRLLRLKRRLRKLAKEEGCGGALLIDYQGFNKSLAKGLREDLPGIRLHQYVCPQVWAWKAGRIPGIGRLFDVLYCLFHFEPALFEGLPVEARWFGHPLVDHVTPEQDRAAFFATHGLDPARPLVALLPGSRRSELERLMPALAGLVRQWPDPITQWVLPVASNLDPAFVREFLGDLPVVLATGANLASRAHADAAVVCSGTATLETALLGTPYVLVYRTSALTYALGKRLVKLPSIGLANIVAGKRVVTELIQHEVTPERLVVEVQRLFEPAVAAEMRQELSKIRGYLGESGAMARVARHLAESLEKGE